MSKLSLSGYDEQLMCLGHTLSVPSIFSSCTIEVRGRSEKLTQIWVGLVVFPPARDISCRAHEQLCNDSIPHRIIGRRVPDSVAQLTRGFLCK